jgi:hypothetical protein
VSNPGNEPAHAGLKRRRGVTGRLAHGRDLQAQRPRASRHPNLNTESKGEVPMNAPTGPDVLRETGPVEEHRKRPNGEPEPQQRCCNERGQPRNSPPPSEEGGFPTFIAGAGI